MNPPESLGDDRARTRRRALDEILAERSSGQRWTVGLE